jgi:hypothetical protein
MRIEGSDFKWSSKEAATQPPVIAPGFAMLERAKRASYIDPPAEGTPIPRRTMDGKDVHGELDRRPQLENIPPPASSYAIMPSAHPRTMDPAGMFAERMG